VAAFSPSGTRRDGQSGLQGSFSVPTQWNLGSDLFPPNVSATSHFLLCDALFSCCMDAARYFDTSTYLVINAKSFLFWSFSLISYDGDLCFPLEHGPEKAGRVRGCRMSLISAFQKLIFTESRATNLCHLLSDERFPFSLDLTERVLAPFR